jgi:LysM repeat protein
MSERPPNPIARIAAVFALLVAFFLVTAVLFTSGGDSDDDGGNGGSGNGDVVVGEPTREGQQALEKGSYVVKEGDTLAQIAADTGLELDELVELNPQLDPQALIAGERVRLR